MDRLNGKLSGLNNLSGLLQNPNTMRGNLTTIKGDGTRDYNKLNNKPSINEVELVGDKTFEDLGDHLMTNIEIKQIFDRVFNG